MKPADQPIVYAIVDIETTGGYAAGSSITEIAILVHDGTKIIDRFCTLVNPQREIPLPIFSLTGIDNEMVKDSPVFEEVAGKVFDMLQGRVFVAHSVNFDYSFVKHHLDQAGYKFSAPKLCTVRMCRKIRPGLRSYSLGNLCRVLSIPIADRHRAGGDADATAVLFSRLLEWDTEGVIPAMLRKNSGEQRLPPNLPKEDFEGLPSCPGVYYFRDKGGKVVYVGKAVNIKKRVASHFTGHNPNPQRQHFLRTIYSISFEPCATELMALLLECLEIKRLWPAYNRALKRFEPKFGLYSYEDQKGYLRLAVGKLGRHQRCIQPFNRLYDAIKTLNMLVETFGLERRLCTFGVRNQAPWTGLNARENKADLPSAREYNDRIHRALDHLLENQPTFLILDKGKDEEEISCIWVEKGNFYGMGYVAKDTDLTSPEDIRDTLTRYPSNYYSVQLIYAFAERNPGKVKKIEPVSSVSAM